MSPYALHTRDDLWASLALRHTRGLGPRTWQRLLTHYGSAVHAVAQASSWTKAGLVRPQIQTEFSQGHWQRAAQKEKEQVQQLKLQAVFYHEPEYPELLRQIPDPPLFLYTLGASHFLTQPCIAMVGSRQASHYGLGMAKTIALQLSQAGICVVSGLAQGIDRAAHQGALPALGSTIAVLGTGPDLIYPASNRDLWPEIASQGLIVSEFAPGTKPEGSNFPHRNRIISGLSLGVVVVEAALASGSLITAKQALLQGREVFAVPGPANLNTFQGSHQLIREGACLVQNAQDILQELEPILGKILADSKPMGTKTLVPENKDQQKIFDYLHHHGSVHIDILTRHLDWPADQVSATLLLMEVQGLVIQHPGMIYSVTT